MPIELTLILAAFAASLLVGVPAIRLGIWLPRDLEFEVVSDERMTDAQRAHFARLDGAVAALAYFPRLTFATNLQGATLTRMYLCDHDSAVLGAHCMRAASVLDERHPSGHNYLEWITRYEDGTTLTTLNAELGEVFDRMPHQVKQKCVGVTDPAALKARHDRKAENLAGRLPRSPHGVDALAEFRDYHHRFCDFQVSRGLLIPANARGRHSVTVKTALRGVMNFFNPLADNFTLPRFLAAFVVGTGLPLLAVWLVDPHAAGRPSGLPVLAFTVLERRAMLAGASVLAGGAIGWIFNSKQMVWAALLGYLPLRLAGSSGATAAALLMALVAEIVARIRLRRDLLV